jgi:hypothetical protein
MHEREINARAKGDDVPKYAHPSSCDEPVRGFRSWWRKYGYAASPPNTFGPASLKNLKRLSRREQLDPWNSHTKQCSTCRSVLRVAKRTQRLSLVMVAAGALFTRGRHPIVACLLLAFGVLARLRADRFVAALEGESSFPSNIHDRTFVSAD